VATDHADESTVFEAINGMLLDMLAAVARKDYDDRRRAYARPKLRAATASASARNGENGELAMAETWRSISLFG
jgi:hypothetical protein